MTKRLSILVALMMFFATFSVSAQVDILKNLPRDSDLVFTINFKQLLSNPNVKKAIEENLNSTATSKKNYDEFLKQTGLDIYKDLDFALIFTTGKIMNKAGQQVAGALISGNFQPAKILEAIKNDPGAAKDVEIGKIDKFDAVIPKNGDDGYGVFLNNKTLLLGSKSGVQAVINVVNKKAPNLSNKKDFAAILNKLNMKATVAGSGIFTKEMKDGIKSNPQFAVLSAINYFLFDFTSADTIALNFNAEVDEQKNVEGVSTALNGFLAMGKIFATQVPELGEVLNSIRVGSAGKTVSISLNISKAKLEEIKKQIEERTNKNENPGSTQQKFNRD